MKNQALFSAKDKSKKLKCHLLQFLYGPLRVKFAIHIKSSAVQKLIIFFRQKIAVLLHHNAFANIMSH